MDPAAVGNAFVSQYFQILHQSPELVHRFYQEKSQLSRPDSNGDLVTVTTAEAINEMILAAVDYSEFKAEIQTVDTQESYNDGVIVLVTGIITGKDFIKKDFIQSFFLAPQDKGFYVLNDIFRYTAKDEYVVPANGTASDYLNSRSIEVEDQTQLPLEDEDNVEEVYNPPVEEEQPEQPAVEEEQPAIVEEVPIAEVIDEILKDYKEVIDEIPKDSKEVAAVANPPTTVTGETPKISYATMVKIMKENPAPISVPAPVPTRPAPKKHEKRSYVAPVASQVSVTNGSNFIDNKNIPESEADGYSIHVKNLPFNATPVQLEEEFKKFGSIKPDGIQIRSHKMHGFCFGFVEFESSSAVQSAIEASPVMMDGRKVFVEKKRTSSTQGNNKGRFISSRGDAPHIDGGRGRGSGGRGYARGNQNSRGSFGNRSGGRGRGDFPNRASDVGPSISGGSHDAPRVSTTA